MTTATAPRPGRAPPPGPVIDLPRLRADQWTIATHPARVKVVAMGRRWGKSTLGGTLALTAAIGPPDGPPGQGVPVAWVVPIYKNARPVWRFILQQVRDLERAGHAIVRRGERVVEFPYSGGRISVYSADNDTALRGEAFGLVIVDEAARIGEDTFTDVLLPTLADYDGTIILISTPRGKNWFWREWLKGRADGRYQAAFQAATAANPIPQIRAAYQMARRRMGPRARSFLQEWQAQFIDDGGVVFRAPRRLVDRDAPTAAHAGRVYVAGVDLGRYDDYTVVTVIDATERPVRVVAISRFTGLPWSLQQVKIEAVVHHYRPVKIIVDATGAGDPVWEALAAQLTPLGVEVAGFVFTNLSKARIVERLSMAIDRARLRFFRYEPLLGELETFESKQLPSGVIRYTAPDGMHDDCVASLALALEAATDAVPPVPIAPTTGGVARAAGGVRSAGLGGGRRVTAGGNAA